MSTPGMTRHRRRRKNQVWASLIEVMDEKGETDESLGTKLNLSPRAIRSYMYGEVIVSMRRLEQLVRALGTTEERLRQDGPLPPLNFGEDALESI